MTTAPAPWFCLVAPLAWFHPSPRHELPPRPTSLLTPRTCGARQPLGHTVSDASHPPISREEAQGLTRWKRSASPSQPYSPVLASVLDLARHRRAHRRAHAAPPASSPPVDHRSASGFHMPSVEVGHLRTPTTDDVVFIEAGAVVFIHRVSQHRGPSGWPNRIL